MSLLEFCSMLSACKFTGKLKTICLLLFACAVTVVPLHADEPKSIDSVAGRSLQEWSADLKSENEIVRARAAKTLPQFGAKADESLRVALDDPSAAVQYWAAQGFGLIGEASAESEAALKELAANKKENPAVAGAASYALCQLANDIESAKPHLDFLIERVQINDRAIACSTADLLMQLGEKAKPAIAVLEKIQKQHAKKKGNTPGVDYHIRGAVQNALREISEDWRDK